MLIIRRKAGESILIGEDVEIRVVDTAGGRVKLGIFAPREVIVLRKEVKETGEQNRAAAESAAAGNFATLAERLRK